MLINMEYCWILRKQKHRSQRYSIGLPTICKGYTYEECVAIRHEYCDTITFELRGGMAITYVCTSKITRKSYLVDPRDVAVAKLPREMFRERCCR